MDHNSPLLQFDRNPTFEKFVKSIQHSWGSYGIEYDQWADGFVHIKFKSQKCMEKFQEGYIRFRVRECRSCDVFEQIGD